MVCGFVWFGIVLWWVVVWWGFGWFCVSLILGVYLNFVLGRLLLGVAFVGFCLFVSVCLC